MLTMGHMIKTVEIIGWDHSACAVIGRSLYASNRRKIEDI